MKIGLILDSIAVIISISTLIYFVYIGKGLSEWLIPITLVLLSTFKFYLDTVDNPDLL